MPNPTEARNVFNSIFFSTVPVSRKKTPVRFFSNSGNEYSVDARARKSPPIAVSRSRGPAPRN